MKSPLCSVIVRAYNESGHIGRLLDGINKQSIQQKEIVVVDSGSTDDTVQISKSYGAKIIEIDPAEFSFGRSLNRGIAAAKGKYIVICSAHVYPVYPDWLERLLDPFQDQKIALTYGKQRGIAESHFSENQIFQHWFPDHSQRTQAHPFCNNANAAIRRELWEKHPFNENLPALEDLAWAKWVHDQGYGIAYISDAEIIHIHHENWKNIENRYKREGMAFKQIYPQESFRLGDLIRLFCSNAINDLLAAKEERVVIKQFWGILRFRWMQFHGTYLGYKQSGPLTWRLKQAFYYPRDVIIRSQSSKSRDVKPIQYDG
jgi:rhamnosyltransferase